MENDVTVTELGAGAAELSPLALFLQADVIVQAVMIGLVIASVWCWAIIFDKLFHLRRLNQLADRFEARFWSGGSLEELYERIGNRPRDPMSSLFTIAMREWQRSQARSIGGVQSGRAGLAARIERVMTITLDRELDRVERRLGVLASTGSVAPFVGLFGTVWGIMNSFSAIGIQENISLATVAPGIAEALFSTAIGLIAAIPAVIAYNKLSNDIDRYGRRLENFAGEFGAILSRQLDEKT